MASAGPNAALLLRTCHVLDVRFAELHADPVCCVNIPDAHDSSLLRNHHFSLLEQSWAGWVAEESAAPTLARLWAAIEGEDGPLVQVVRSLRSVYHFPRLSFASRALRTSFTGIFQELLHRPWVRGSAGRWGDRYYDSVDTTVSLEPPPYVDELNFRLAARPTHVIERLLVLAEQIAAAAERAMNDPLKSPRSEEQRPVPDDLADEVLPALAPPPDTPFEHTDDFATFRVGDINYTFTPSQRGVVKALWEARDKGTPGVATLSLLAAAGSEGLRLRDVFKVNRKLHPAWGVLIVSVEGAKGVYRLQLD